MLHRGAHHASLHRGAAGAGPSKVVLAVAPPPRVGSPTHWGWPHWLAPVYRTAGQHPSSPRTLEDYG